MAAPMRGPSERLSAAGGPPKRAGAFPIDRAPCGPRLIIAQTPQAR